MSEAACRRDPRTTLATLALTLAAACGSDAPPGWTLLEPAALENRAERRGRWGAFELRLVHGPEGSALELDLPHGAWQRDEARELWFVQVPLRVPTERKRLALATPDGPIPRSDVSDLIAGDAGGFNFRRQTLFLAGFSEPPQAATLTCTLPLATADTPRLRCGRFAGHGFDVLPGRKTSARVALPRDALLRFGTAWEPLLDGGDEEVVFRVRLEGELLFEHRTGAGRAAASWHAVALPPEGRASARFDFEIEGVAVHGVFLEPLLAPSSIGAPGRRPWAETRPDIVVFLADTLRADSLTSCGADARVAPNLDELAEQGLCFTRARSTASWTLPAHASLFTGHYPRQVLGPGGNFLADDAHTIAEHLRRAGYRTGAVTDGGFVSRQFGLDQGFGYFVELAQVDKDLPELLTEARSFLAADDGRPVFLFVQTYRAHWPYEGSAHARAQHGERLGLEPGLEADALLARLVAEAHALGATEVSHRPDVRSLPRSPAMKGLVRQLRALYLAGVADLDHELAGFLGALRERGLFDTGYLVFTSDHGESFHEHEALFHGVPPHEEQARIPLLVVGRGLARARIDAPVSLIDLPPTLAAMARLAPDPAWTGRSLLALHDLGAERVLFGFEESEHPEPALFVLEGERKVLLVREEAGARLLGGFDLAHDPGEAHDAAVAGAAWPGELAARHRERLEAALRPLFDARRGGATGEADAAKAEELRALGY